MALPSESRPEGRDTDGDGMPDEWERANGFDPSDAADGNYINPEGYTALEKYLCSIMGEEIKGTFGNASAIRSAHAVRFGVETGNGAIVIKGGDELRSFHVFDSMGRCRITGSLHGGDNRIDARMLGKGVYIVWATDAGGYRNAVKVTLK